MTFCQTTSLIVQSNECRKNAKHKHLTHQKEAATGGENYSYYSCVKQIQGHRCPVNI